MKIGEWALGQGYDALLIGASAIALMSLLPQVRALASFFRPSHGKWNAVALIVIGIIGCIIAVQQCLHLGLL
jgi:hypothetical protein